MKLADRWMGAARVAVLVIAGLQMTGCRTHVEALKTEHPAEVQAISGSELKRVTLTERAVQRLDVKTDEVRDRGGQSVVPYSSLIYDPTGHTWVYTSPAPRTFVRQEVEIDRIIGDLVMLKSGPRNGTVIASRAVAELYGAEFKVGH